MNHEIPFGTSRNLVEPLFKLPALMLKLLGKRGNLNSQIDLNPETGADCISVNAGVSLGDVYERYRDSVVTAGNVDVINTIYGGDPALICGAVADCVARVTDPHRRYILMPSCDLPPNTPLRDVTEFLTCADKGS
jgi:uroporphyrinogen decarboxylase